MVRKVRRDAPSALIVDASVQFVDGDCWHIFAAAGNMAKFYRFLEAEEQHERKLLQWFSWERNNKLRFYTRERVLKHVKNGNSVGNTVL